MIPVAALGISFFFDPTGGFIRDFTVTDQGRQVAPLHTAPWVTQAEPADPATPVVLSRLAGDFFCAPFAGTDGGSPLHGWPANGEWQVQQGMPLRAMLDHPVMGAQVVKELTLIDGHPFLYQRHMFTGGAGALPVANHAMVALPNGGLLRFSPKRWFESSALPQETDPLRGRSGLSYPARATDPRSFPTANGGAVDLTTYPWFDRTEDFVVGIEAPRDRSGNTLGWTAVTRPSEGDLYLSLRHGQHLPMTMLWHSNGGRDYAPWSGRHYGCLGVEEGAALHMLGLGSQEQPDPLTAAGQRPCLTLAPDRVADVRHVIGAIAWPSGQGVATVVLTSDSLTVTGQGGAVRILPIRGDFLRTD